MPALAVMVYSKPLIVVSRWREQRPKVPAKTWMIAKPDH
jgi:hypothetical protein